MALFTPEERRRLTLARKGMNPKQIQCVRLRVEGFTAAQVAALLGCHERTVQRACASMPGKVYAATLHELADGRAMMMAAGMMTAINAQEALARVG